MNRVGIREKVKCCPQKTNKPLVLPKRFQAFGSLTIDNLKKNVKKNHVIYLLKRKHAIFLHFFINPPHRACSRLSSLKKCDHSKQRVLVKMFAMITIVL